MKSRLELTKQDPKVTGKVLFNIKESNALGRLLNESNARSNMIQKSSPPRIPAKVLPSL
jgi:hypothetical protein